MLSDADILSLLMGRRANHSLPQAFYTDADVFDADMRNIWHKEWMFALPAVDISKSGNYATLQIGAYSIIVVRGADGVVRAFHNSCRHRGSRICAAAKGSSPKLVCPYHQWTYELDGKLLWAREMGPDFKPQDHGLKIVHCADVSGMIFICLADHAPDITELKEQAARYMGPHDLGNLKVAHQSSIIEKGNWKLVLENNRECYHCSGSHPSLCRTFSDDPNLVGADPSESSNEGLAHVDRCEQAGLPAKFVIDPSEQWRFVRIPFLGDAVSYTMDGKAAVSKRIGTVPFENAGSCLFFHYPNTWNHFLSDQALVFRVLPIGPMETEVTTFWLVHKDAEEGRDYDLKRLTEVWEHTNDEDRQIIEENQRGILSPAYEPGPYSVKQESGVIQFVDWYARTLEQALVGRFRVAAE
ncbi:aromatic ring-hydroxylating dioxygenase subunit alpha [Roseibium denhamense]|uniref:Rieske 2Fe-2S family protein n=1 Tax=Roseibium denhamense TaxID=76305 RepID=A0ABY1NRX9_9HYPH|nr:aromatic ring-hydroxylating dioxygenase subunit alpha [Roseibium denhamense]MTI08148.1 aromatic ring-hydroxylating dioxygenase subunit alpha [Roseibium denhamense]SMP16704.1 Rieske 2Fe-2S family protein [Roseibium denhamense]